MTPLFYLMTMPIALLRLSVFVLNSTAKILFQIVALAYVISYCDEFVMYDVRLPAATKL
jgi:hypothetical protein